MRAALAFSALVALAAAGDVVQLTPDNFEAEVGDASYDLVLVKFYAPWCGHCKSMAADYEEAATQVKASHPKIKLAEFDADAHRDYASKYEVQGFPTLKVFRGGDLKSPDDYSGPRSLDGIVKAVIKLAKPSLLEFTTVAELDAAKAKALEEGETVITATFKADGKDVDAFRKFAKKAAKSFTVLIIPTGAPSRGIHIQAPGEDASEYDDTRLSVAKLTAWSDKNKFPAFGEISQENFKSYVDRGIPLGWMFVDPADTATFESITTMMTDIGRRLRGRISLVHLSGPQYGQMAERVGLEGKAWPGFGIDDQTNKKHFAWKPEGSLPEAAALEKFINDVLDGKIEPTVRSEAEPATQPDDEGVFILTGNNFLANTIDSKKDVFVEFYAPWCGHCKALAPEYAQLAQAGKGSANLLIAKMDATQNDIPSAEFDVSGYPTLYFIKASPSGGPGKVMSYSGGRTKADIQKYIEEHATHPVSFD